MYFFCLNTMWILPLETVIVLTSCRTVIHFSLHLKHIAIFFCWLHISIYPRSAFLLLRLCFLLSIDFVVLYSVLSLMSINVILYKRGGLSCTELSVFYCWYTSLNNCANRLNLQHSHTWHKTPFLTHCAHNIAAIWRRDILLIVPSCWTGLK